MATTGRDLIEAARQAVSTISTTDLQQDLADSSCQIAFFGTQDQPLKDDGIHLPPKG